MPLLVALPAALFALPSTAQAGSVRLTTPGCGGEGSVSANEFTIPAGVHRISLIAHGEQGGDSGGQGSWLTGDLSVAPGGVLYACVDIGGGRGGSGSVAGADGGGYTSVSVWPDGSSPLMIAGGGGGRGGAVGGATGGAGGTAALGRAAGNGLAGTSGDGGGGASDSGAGSGGASLAGATGDGRRGAIRAGGSGGAGVAGGAGGGGGGGGVWGGGGGAGSDLSDGDGGGAGGGAGNSYCDVSGCRAAVAGGAAYVQVSWVDPPATTTTTVTSSDRSPVRNTTVTYTATVAPTPSGGTVEFQLDDAPLLGCTAQPVDGDTGKATCGVAAPWASAEHGVRAVYSGTTGFEGSHGDTTIEVRAPRATVAPSPVDFGSAVIGMTVERVVTVSNDGTSDLEVEDGYGIMIAGVEPDSLPVGVGMVFARDLPVNDTDFEVLADGCSGTVVAPGHGCDVTIAFRPTLEGERGAKLYVGSDAENSVKPVALTGIGLPVPTPDPTPDPDPTPNPIPTPDPVPAPSPAPQPQPAPTPATPGQPAAPTSTPPAPAVPARTPPAARGETTPATPPAPASPRGAVLAPAANNRAEVTEAPAGSDAAPRVKLPVRCPVGEPCRVGGTLTLAVTAGRRAQASATTKRVLVRFAGIRVAADRTRTLSLRLPKAFVKAQQAKGVRKLRTTLTIRTTLGSGASTVTRQSVTLLIPRARVAQQQTAPEPARQPSFTG